MSTVNGPQSGYFRELLEFISFFVKEIVMVFEHASEDEEEEDEEEEESLPEVLQKNYSLVCCLVFHCLKFDSNSMRIKIESWRSGSKTPSYGASRVAAGSSAVGTECWKQVTSCFVPAWAFWPRNCASVKKSKDEASDHHATSKACSGVE